MGAGGARLHDRLLRRQAALLPGRRHRRARRQRHCQRPRRRRRAPLWLAPASCSRRASRSPTSAGSRARWRRAAEAAGVAVVAGDTKVVERGSADGLFVTTAGVGRHAGGSLRPAREPGDRSSSRARSATTASPSSSPAATSSSRARSRATRLRSTSSPRHSLELGPALRWMRDPTRGGLATTLNELAPTAGLAVRLDEPALPVRAEVAGAAEILGIDPLYVANEGKLVAVVAPGGGGRRARRLRGHPLGRDAALIGEVRAEPPGPRPPRYGTRRQPDRRHAGRRSAAEDLLSPTAESRHTTCRWWRPMSGEASPGTVMPARARTAEERVMF